MQQRLLPRVPKPGARTHRLPESSAIVYSLAPVRPSRKKKSSFASRRLLRSINAVAATLRTDQMTRLLVPLSLALAFTIACSKSESTDAREILPKAELEFKGKVERLVKDSTPDFPKGVEAPKGAPNVLLILTDDVGFGASNTFGGPDSDPDVPVAGRQWVEVQHVSHHCVVLTDTRDRSGRDYCPPLKAPMECLRPWVAASVDGGSGLIRASPSFRMLSQTSQRTNSESALLRLCRPARVLGRAPWRRCLSTRNKSPRTALLRLW